MELGLFFKSVIDQDLAPVVLCDLNHTIIYMNKAAIKSYENRGGEKLLGKSLLECHNQNSVFKITAVLHWFSESKENNSIHSFYNEKENKDVYMIALRDDLGNLIGYYEKHEYRTKDDTPFYSFG